MTTKEEAITAVERFVTANCHMRSTRVIKSVMADVQTKIGNAGELFVVPLSHKLFGYTTGLLWLAFIADLARRCGNIPFNCGESLKILAELFDLDHDDLIAAHYAADYSSSESEDESEDESGPCTEPDSDDEDK